MDSYCRRRSSIGTRRVACWTVFFVFTGKVDFITRAGAGHLGVARTAMFERVRR
jgi:hypothetical protein